MGFKKFKRPIDARTRGGGSTSIDIKFDVASSTGSLTIPTITSTGSIAAEAMTSTGTITAEAFASTSKVTAPQFRRTGITTTTGASTALATRGLHVLNTTSTSADLNLILSLPVLGDELQLVIGAVATSSWGFTINASTATLADFGSLTTATPQIRATMSTLGAQLHLVGLSSARWAVVGQSGITFSTAAA